MTLKEKFIKLYPHQTEDYLDYEEAEMCEQIADDYAIEFAEWRLTTHIKNADEYTMRELLEIFKKEKGL